MTFPTDSALPDFSATGGLCRLGTDQFDVEAFCPADFWRKARLQVLSIAQLSPDWDGDGAVQVPPLIAISALHLLRALQNRGYPAPNDVYPLSEGTLVVEWQFPNDVILRIEVDGSGKGEQMVSYPTAPCQFARVTWAAAFPSHWVSQSQKLWAQRLPSPFAVDATRTVGDNLPLCALGDCFQTAA